jgi:hypothetical protein
VFFWNYAKKLYWIFLFFYFVDRSQARLVHFLVPIKPEFAEWALQ